MKTTTFIVLLLVITGCRPSVPDSRDAAIAALQARTTTIEQQLQDATNHIAWLSGTLSNLDERIFGLQFNEDLRTNEWCSVDLTANGYSILDNKTTPILFISKSATPYLDGYRIHFWFGNLSISPIPRLKVDYRWGPNVPTNFNDKDAWKSYQAAQKHGHVDLTETLAPGRWTPADIVVVPCSTEEVKNLQMRADVSTLQLREPPENTSQ